VEDALGAVAFPDGIESTGRDAFLSMELESGTSGEPSRTVLAGDVGAVVVGAKYPEISSTKCDGFDAKALTEPLVVGTNAMFDVTAPSPAFREDTVGCVPPCGHNVRKPSGPGGTTVAFSTYDWADAGAPQPLLVTFTSFGPLNGGEPGGLRVSSTRHGDILNSDSPPTPGGAKYPLTSITRSESFVTKTETSPFAAAGTMAAFAVTAPVGALRVETTGCVCPAGQVVRKPKLPLGTEV
jgi:hypothetical protein